MRFMRGLKGKVLPYRSSAVNVLSLEQIPHQVQHIEHVVWRQPLRDEAGDVEGTEPCLPRALPICGGRAVFFLGDGDSDEEGGGGGEKQRVSVAAARVG